MQNEITITAEQVEKMKKMLKRAYKTNDMAAKNGAKTTVAETCSEIFTIQRMFDIMGIEY